MPYLAGTGGKPAVPSKEKGLNKERGRAPNTRGKEFRGGQLNRLEIVLSRGGKEVKSVTSLVLLQEKRLLAGRAVVKKQRSSSSALKGRGRLPKRARDRQYPGKKN